jgi:hypothetical protein
MSARTLKVEATGDFHRLEQANKAPMPKIRISGYWLARAGFPSGHRVEVTQDQPGELRLRVVAEKAVAQ